MSHRADNHAHQDQIRQRSSEVERISPLFNDAFIRIFGGKSSRNVTRGLINAILRAVDMTPIGEIEKINSEESKYTGSIGCRTGRVDVCVVAEGRVFDVEAQRFPEDVANRSMFYASQIICDSMRHGMGFDEMPQVVVITLLDAPAMFPDSDDFIRISSMQWNGTATSEVDPCTDRMVFILVELEKIRKRYTNLTADVLNDETLAWLYLLTQGFEDEGETMKIAEKFPTIEEFAEQYGIAIDDPEIKAKYRAYDSAVREYKSQQKYLARVRREAAEQAEKEGREKGLAKGLSEGMAKGRAEGMAKGLAEGKAKGLSEGMAKGLSEGMAKGLIEGRTEGLAKGKAEGLAEGKTAGEEAERSRLIEAMRAQGIDEETIARIVE